jgi:hypothetical protein
MHLFSLLRTFELFTFHALLASLFTHPSHLFELRLFVTSLHNHTLKLHKILDIYIKIYTQIFVHISKEYGSALDLHKTRLHRPVQNPFFFMLDFSRTSSMYNYHRICSKIQSRPSIFFIVTQHTLSTQQVVQFVLDLISTIDLLNCLQEQTMQS